MVNTNNSEIIIYQAADGLTKIEVRLDGETVWLSQAQIARLFGRDRSVITKHIRNIFAEGKIDEKSNAQILYVANSGKPVMFYNLDVIINIVQNKLHYAASGHTASEIIFNRANAELPFMGLTVFKGCRPVKNEVTIAKNYMTEKGLFALRRMVSAFFDMAELKAERHEPMYMKDWLHTLDTFCRDFGMGILENAGSVSHIEAVEKVHREYGMYRARLPDDLTDVEKAYLETLKQMQKEIISKGNGNEQK
jgi:hypothetical protein